MITNERQLRRAASLLAEFTTRLEVLEATASRAERPRLRAIEIAAVRSQMDSLRAEMLAYHTELPQQV